jgi:galactose-1-phosphate uridylyltransferase
VSPAHDRLELIIRHSHHQIMANDSAAHPTAAQECEAAKHLAFGDVVATIEGLADAIRKWLVEGHGIAALV